MWHSWVSWCLESWRLDPYASHLRHIGYVGLSQSPMARSPDLLAGPKLTEQPRWLVFLEPQFELRVLGHQPRGLCKSGVAGRGRGGGEGAIFILSERLKTPASLVPYSDEESRPKKSSDCDSVELPTYSKCFWLLSAAILRDIFR